MSLQNIILYGSFAQKNMKRARDIVLANLSAEAGFPKEYIEKHVAALTYPNFFFLSGRCDEISIAQTMEMQEFLAGERTLGGKKIVLIESCDNMSRNAANSILKCLEECDAKNMIILTTTRLSMVLPTVRSRCRKIAVTSDDVSNTCPQTMSEHIFSELLNREIETTYDFVENVTKIRGTADLNNFLKSLPQAQIKLVPDILVAKAAYLLSQSPSLLLAKKFLEMQNIVTVAKQAHSDMQYLSIACFIILG